MAAHQQQQPSESDDDDEFHSLSGQGDELNRHERDGASDAFDNEDMTTAPPPAHPVPSFQGAFDESIVESAEATEELDATDAEMRRRRLLQADRYEDTVATRWKQRPGSKHHPFVKLMAQIVFGMHLLQEGQAKSNEEVVKILQAHVNEVDGFLERTAEDFDLAIRDIEERVRYLKLPMQHMDVFETMLDEKKFRTDLLNGNEKIEKIIDKTTKARRAAMQDIYHGAKSTKELSRYLEQVESRWPKDDHDIAEVFAAMRGNEEGWMRYLRALRTKGDNLKSSLQVLETVIAETSKHAAAASRRNKIQSRTVSPTIANRSSTSSPLRSKFAQDPSHTVHKKPGPWLDKPLPQEPNAVPGVQQAAMSKPHPVSLATRYEQPRQRVPAPTSKSTTIGNQPQPRTASGPGPNSQFLRNSGGLRSHPPDSARDARSHTKAHAQSTSQGGSHGVTNRQNRQHKDDGRQHRFRRPRSQGATAIAASDENSKETRYIPRKPIQSKTDRVDEGPPSAMDNKQDSAAYGFSRRISRKLKGIEVPRFPSTVSSTRKEISPPRPIDSAHSSTGDKEARPSDDTDKPRPSPEIEKPTHVSIGPDANPLQQGHVPHVTGKETRVGHSLFPPINRSLTPSQPIRGHRVESPARDTKAFITSDDASQQISPSNEAKLGGRSLSLKAFFHHRKGNGSRNIVVS